MSRLVIRQAVGDAGFRFIVERVRPDGIKAAPAVDVADPLSRTLGQTALRLGGELSWYLESYLDYPYGPNVQRAERVTSALRAWGTEAFRRRSARVRRATITGMPRAAATRTCTWSWPATMRASWRGPGRRCTIRWWATWRTSAAWSDSSTS